MSVHNVEDELVDVLGDDVTEIELLGHLVEKYDEVGDDADELPDAEVHHDVNQLGDGGSPAGHLAHVVQFFVFVFAHSNL